MTRFALGVLGIVTGCAHHPPRLDPHCAPPEPIATAVDPSPVGLLRGRTIGSVAVTGADPALTATLRRVVVTRPGDSLDGAPVADDIRRLWALGVLSDVQVDVAAGRMGADVTFAVTPQPIIEHVYMTGRDPDALELRRLRMLEGTPYEPLRVARMAAATQTSLVYNGYLDAKVSVQRAREGAGLCVVADRGPRVVIDAITFPGATLVPHAQLASKLRGDKVGVNHVGGIYDEELISEDRLGVLEVYDKLGRIDTKVDDPKQMRHGDRVSIEIPVHESPVFRVGSITVFEPGGSTVALGIARGDLASNERIAAARDHIQARTFADTVYVTPKRDREHHTVDLEFRVAWRWPWHVLSLLRSR